MPAGGTPSATLLGIGAGLVLTVFLSNYAAAAIALPNGLPAWRFVAWLGASLFIPTAGAIPLRPIMDGR